MIYDCFTFLNELDLLEIRFKELYDTVDKFVLVESDRTFRGDKKELVFEVNKERFRPWLDKVVHIVVTDMPDGYDPSPREHWQREAFKRGTGTVGDLDLVMLCDVDEIPSVSGIKFWQPDMGEVLSLHMKMYKYYLNLRNRWDWYGARMIRGDYYNSHSVKESRWHPISQDRIIRGGGWHFTFMGGYDAIYYKTNSTSHCYDATSADMLKRFKVVPPDIEEAHCHTLESIDDVRDWPKALVQEQHLYAHMVKLR